VQTLGDRPITAAMRRRLDALRARRAHCRAEPSAPSCPAPPAQLRRWAGR
jgi:hypothetical protein